MDFKKYVRTMLEEKKAKEKEEEEVKEKDTDEETDKEEEDEEEIQASTKTAETGAEPSCKTKYSADTDEEDTDEEDEDDTDEEDEDSDEEDEEKEKDDKKSLKESMIYSAKVLNNNYYTSNVVAEQTKTLIEEIKNNTLSKHLNKLAETKKKKASDLDGKKKEKMLSEAALLKEAANKIYRCETKYKAGNAFAKEEYKKIKKQYSEKVKF